MPLKPATAYYFWFEVGAPVAHSIEAAPAPLPDLPTRTRLRVALFGFEGELLTAEDKDVGEIELGDDGSATVTRQPDRSPATDLRARRLLFPIRTPEEPGIHRLRCSVYKDQVLIESRLVQARVMRSPRRVPGALRAVVDYRLVHAPRAEHLAAIPPHRLSLMINDNKDGTHGFRFLGANEFKNEASFTGDELQHLIEITRGGLRLAAWGDDNPWTTQAYRYGGAADDARLRTDLVRFAIRGYRFYDAVVNRLAGGVTKAEELAALMVKPGLVQIALKESARHVLPAALIYDQPGFNTNADPARYRLCPEFLAARARPEPLDQLGCFTKGCPHRDEETVVCPSGFWGYRHSLGLPVTVAAAPDAPTSIAAKGAPGLAVAVSTDPNLTERRAHEETLKALRVGLGWGYGDTLERTIALLKTTTAQVVYFYCHGGVTATHIPYLQVGALTDDAMTRDVLRAKKIRWATSRPLVFINGCHTTALEPEIALDFVSAFVENAYAGGVIGTEITVFEPLARGFAEDFLRRFLDGVPVGEAVRATRLQMLKDGNPLGLAYIPFVLPSLNLVAA